MQIGVMLNNLEPDRITAWKVAGQEGFSLVHTNAVAESWLEGVKRTEYLSAARSSGLTIDTMFIGFDGQDYSNIDAIARTVGLLAIPEWRRRRIDVAKKYTHLAADLNVSRLALHLGFLPKNDQHPDYQILVQAVREIADACAERGQTLHFETGQESAVELLRFIHAAKRDNLGVNFDCGNFLLYGTDDPLIALAVLQPYIRGVHCKDGYRPTTPGQLGREVPLGQGAMDFPKLVQQLQASGYAGSMIIERESGPDARAEIQQARAYLEKVIQHQQT